MFVWTFIYSPTKCIDKIPCVRVGSRVFTGYVCDGDFCVSHGDLAIARLTVLICDHCHWNAAILRLRSKDAILSYPISILSSSRFSVLPTLGLVFAKKKAISAAQLVARLF